MTTASPLHQFITFLTPIYQKEDPMHDLTHIARLLKKADEIKGGAQLDDEAIIWAAYVHGIRKPDLPAVEQWLYDRLPRERAEKILGFAHESHSKSTPHTPEGIILHDAHLLEGDENFLALKCLLTSAYRGERPEQAIDFTEKNIIGKFRCADPQRQQEYLRREDIMRRIFLGLKNDL